MKALRTFSRRRHSGAGIIGAVPRHRDCVRVVGDGTGGRRRDGWEATATAATTAAASGQWVTLTTALLTLYGYAAWNAVSRRYLDRHSTFRFCAAIDATHHPSLIYGITFTVYSLMASPGSRCDFISFVLNARPLAFPYFAPLTRQQLSLMFSAGIFSYMALNLPLVLAHNVNGQKMEKYYVLGTPLVSLICNVVPYASGKLGWDAINGICLYRGTNPADTMRWLIGTQTFWIMLSAVGEVGAFLIILGHLVMYELDTRRFHSDTQFKTTYLSEASHRAGSTILKFRNIILCIGLYPPGLMSP
ncbi:hypothetical protein B0H14DRAFT_3625324 [Mycena olivaceomarginata]|nr:hypothetical protein B0H14DRAFT_3625324 [Mycena olivaceomarginata]